MQTPAGNLSTKKAPGKTYKRHLRIERIARLSLQVPPLTDDEIAISQGCTKQYVSMLRRTSEYIAIRTQLLTGVVAQADRALYENIEENQDFIKSFVPEAMQALYDTLLDKSNPALRLRAAESILDREGSLAKISKSEIKKKLEVDFSAQDAISADLLEALKHNITKDELIGDPGEGFTSTADAAENREKVQRSMELIDRVDLSPTTDTVQ